MRGGKARPIVRKVGCEINGERDPSPPSDVTVRRAQSQCICRMASLWSARWPFMEASPHPDSPINLRRGMLSIVGYLTQAAWGWALEGLALGQGKAKGQSPVGPRPRIT